jgi:nucleoside-diphosphate-sugar epimerase
MRVLVVGGTGWLGGVTAALLAERGWDVVSLSRRGGAVAGSGVAGDVRLPRFGLSAREAERLADGVTHVVSCFGSVDWELGPREAVELHLAGTRNVLRFAERCPRLERLVHVSSVLALGRAHGRVGNRELQLGQPFRNWYEYAKHVSEVEVRGCHALPRRIVRLGDVLGVAEHMPPSPRHGLLAPLPYLLRGYPAHLHAGGAFPIYVGDVDVAAATLAAALVDDGGGLTWTWFDPALPSLAEVLTALCSPWGVVPRLLDLPALQRVERLVAPRLGLPSPVLEYAKPWVDIDPSVLDQLPAGLPPHAPGYVELTAAALRRQAEGPVGQYL